MDSGWEVNDDQYFEFLIQNPIPLTSPKILHQPYLQPLVSPQTAKPIVRSRYRTISMPKMPPAQKKLEVVDSPVYYRSPIVRSSQLKIPSKTNLSSQRISLRTTLFKTPLLQTQKLLKNLKKTNDIALKYRQIKSASIIVFDEKSPQRKRLEEQLKKRFHPFDDLIQRNVYKI